jgi:ribosomal protein S18 acetylase RimI-like enzyme
VANRGGHERKIAFPAGISNSAVLRERSRAAGVDDLQVISENQAAVSLYQRAGFVKMGELPDMFRIDGRACAYTTMSMRPRVD